MLGSELCCAAAHLYRRADGDVNPSGDVRVHRAESADGFPSLATAAGTKVVKRDPITKKPRSRKVRMFRVCDRVALLNHMSACCCAVTALFNDMFVVRGGVGEAEVRPAGECAFLRPCRARCAERDLLCSRVRADEKDDGVDDAPTVTEDAAAELATTPVRFVRCVCGGCGWVRVRECARGSSWWQVRDRRLRTRRRRPHRRRLLRQIRYTVRLHTRCFALSRVSFNGRSATQLLWCRCEVIAYTRCHSCRVDCSP